MSEFKGATPNEWAWFSEVLGLHGQLLPVVPDEFALPSVLSKVKKFGKIPSAFDKEGRAYGLSKWQSRGILDNELAIWSTDARLGICVRTGSKSGVYAIDVDTNDPVLAAAISEACPPGWPRRARANAAKFLIPIEIRQSPPLDKRIIKLPNGERIEFLADGQQFVCAGTHPSGARYEWQPALPAVFPPISLREFEQLWSSMERFGTPEAVRTVQPGTGSQETLTEISDEDLVKLSACLNHPAVIADAVDNDFWSEVGYALLSLGDVGRNIFCDWSRVAPAYSPDAPEDWWDAHRGQDTRTDYRHIFTLGRRRGWGSIAATNAFEPVVGSEPLRGNGGTGDGVLSDCLDVENRPVSNRPLIRISPANLKANLEMIMAAMDRCNMVYTQGQRLVRIAPASQLPKIIDKKGNEIQRDLRDRGLVPVMSGWLEPELNDICDFEVFDKRAHEWVRTGCPEKYALKILGRGDWEWFKPITAIVRAPFMRKNGSICETEGYDAATGAFLMKNAAFPPLPGGSDDD